MCTVRKTHVFKTCLSVLQCRWRSSRSFTLFRAPSSLSLPRLEDQGRSFLTGIIPQVRGACIGNRSKRPRALLVTSCNFVTWQKIEKPDFSIWHKEKSGFLAPFNSPEFGCQLARIWVSNRPNLGVKFLGCNWKSVFLLEKARWKIRWWFYSQRFFDHFFPHYRT